MIKFIDTQVIEDVVYNLCQKANCQYPADLHNKITEKYHNTIDTQDKQKLENILKNIQLAANTQRPLCQDTGQVIVFIEIGNQVAVKCDLKEIVNRAIARAYKELCFRKSVVKNALFNRENTNNNTPAIIYTDIIKGDKIKIKILIKGAGSENYSNVKMFNPSSSKEEIFEYVYTELARAGEKACPPYVLGIGVGGTMDYSAVLSKKSFFEENNSEDELNFIEELKEYLRQKGCDKNILDIKLKTSSTHIACLPVSITINCHSTRHAQCTITHNTVTYNNEAVVADEIEFKQQNIKEVHTTDIETIKSLKPGDTVLLSGEIYTARDAAHSKLFDMYKKNETLPLDLKDKIIFYAGPCPATQNEVIGPIGPTTSARMDKYTDFICKAGITATIGKGERSAKTIELIKRYGVRYLTVQGGIACILSQCVKNAETIAFAELGTEAIRKLKINKLPITVEI